MGSSNRPPLEGKIDKDMKNDPGIYKVTGTYVDPDELKLMPKHKQPGGSFGNA